MLLRNLTPLLVLAATSLAQSPMIIPAIVGAGEGASSTAYPWGRGTGQIRVQYVYDSANFTNQSVSFPILISQVRWRANGGATGGTGTYNNVTVQMATSPTDYATASTTFASNLGPDLTTVYSGPVTVATGGATTPNNWYVTIPFTTPFLYDPSAGDLTFDFATDATGWVGTAGGAVDCATTNGLTSRIYNLTNYLSATGTFQNNVGITAELTFTAAAGAASATTYGTGCYDRASASFYETFPASTFDLSNTSLRLVPTGTGYLAGPGSNQWFTPVAANLGLTDDSVSAAQPLGFTLNYPGGSTTDVYIASNGFVWAQAGGVNGCCAGDPSLLLAQGARWCALWNDLNPGAGGTVTFDQDLVGGAAYVTFTGIQEFGQAANLNTFQIAFFNTGEVELRWGTCAVTAHVALAGWSPGLGAKATGSIDISASLPILTQPDLNALRLAAGSRPVIGTNVTLTSTEVPAASILGATLLGFVQYNPGIDLAGIGMAGCRQYVDTLATLLFFPAGGTGSNLFAVPNDPAFAGLHVYTQSASFAPGANPLGFITSNGVDLLIGTL